MARRRPKVGLFLPTGEVVLGGATVGWSDLLEFARRAEDLSFDSLWVPDHVLLGQGDERDAMTSAIYIWARRSQRLALAQLAGSAAPWVDHKLILKR